MYAESDIKAVPAEIMVVDDTQANLELLTTILSEHGYVVRPARSGELALKSATAKAPDLILLDVRMPGMDGFEVCRRLKLDSRTRPIPVLFISALVDMADKVKGFELGGLDYVTKPFNTKELLARVKTHLHLYELSQKLEQMVNERTAELVEANSELQQENIERKLAEEALQQQAQKLRENNDELTRFNRAAVGRELRMIELKKEINELCSLAGQPPRYDIGLSTSEGSSPAARSEQGEQT